MTDAGADEKGIQRMFLCSVIVGEYQLGKMNQIVPDERIAESHIMYDSTANKPPGTLLPNERARNPPAEEPYTFVTYHDSQVRTILSTP